MWDAPSVVRILLAHDYAPSFGGAEIMNNVLVRGLRRRGHEVRVFTSTAGLAGGADWPDYSCRGTTSRWRTLLQLANPWATARLRGALDDFVPDVVHVRMFLTQLSPLILPLLRNVPSLYHAVWYRAACPTGHKMLPSGETCTHPAGRACLSAGCVPLRDWVPHMAQRRLLLRWRHVFRATVANSPATAAVLARDGMADVTVIPDGVPRSAAPASFAPPPTAVYAGRLVREKGVDVLLRAFARVAAHEKTAALDIVGDGPERVPLAALAVQLGLAASVRFHGQQSHGQCETIARAAWVQVVPSRWAEPFGLVAVEAMMRGAAVVASGSGGLADIVRHGVTGLLVPPGDVDALAGALRRVLCDRLLAAQWGEAGRVVAEAEYSETLFIDRVLDVYAGIMDPMSMNPAVPKPAAMRGVSVNRE